jgi:hypothetical protein
MNPVVIIPTYWGSPSELATYDHATPLDAQEPELARCLASLEQVRGIPRTILLVVAPKNEEVAARARVEVLACEHPGLTPLIIGGPEARLVAAAVADIAPAMPEGVSLRGYGAIRNLGLVVAGILGHDVAVFLDDDEVCLDANFMVEALYGLGHVTRQNIPVVAKTGYFIDANESPYAARAKSRWADAYWTKRQDFNVWMRRAQNATRISKSNVVCGGCLALTSMVYTSVAFDPFITRGEDLDYLFNLRLYGLEMWFDNEWCVQHLPPVKPEGPARFERDVYRWYYEREKLNFAMGQVHLNQVTPLSLMPYPGPWISSELDRRVQQTVLRHSIVGPNRAAYARMSRGGIAAAKANALEHASSYLEFQSYWPHVMHTLWNDASLAMRLCATGVPAALKRPHINPDDLIREE